METKVNGKRERRVSVSPKAGRACLTTVFTVSVRHRLTEEGEGRRGLQKSE